MPEQIRPGRWSRSDWWGVTIDAPDVGQLVRFYSELRGWKIHQLGEKWATLDPGEGVAYISFQYNEGYVPPTWPGVSGHQQMMVHLDFETADLDASIAHAISLGATVSEHQPRENGKVMLDPAGHPFCFYK